MRATTQTRPTHSLATELASFLWDRLAERADAAYRALDDNAYANGAWMVGGSGKDGCYILDETRALVGSRAAELTPGEADLIAFHDPQWVLADVRAKRQMIERFLNVIADDERIGAEYADLLRGNPPTDGLPSPDRTTDATERRGLLVALKLWASIYAGHPDYRIEWRP